jgi:hypothetical protein
MHHIIPKHSGRPSEFDNYGMLKAAGIAASNGLDSQNRLFSRSGPVLTMKPARSQERICNIDVLLLSKWGSV